GPSTVATILTAVFGCLLMGLYANRPLAVAPYMGENAFIAFGLATMLVDGHPITWQQRLGSVFICGLVFLLITLLRIRTWLANSIAPSMKHSFAVGMGLFLAFIGLYETGMVTSFVTRMPAAELKTTDKGLLLPPDVPVKIGDLHDPKVWLAVFGFVVIAALLCWRVKSAVLLRIAPTAA